MRKFFSIIVSIILIISICFCASVPGSAVFIVDDALIASIGISLAASVLLSIGIAAVSDSESQYVQFAEACGQLVWEQMVQDYTQAEILAMITIENGKAYFRCPESLFNRLKNWANSFNWSSVKAQTSLNISNFPEISWNFAQGRSQWVYDIQPSILTITQFGNTISYNPNIGLTWTLCNDNITWFYKGRNLNQSGMYGCLSPFDQWGYVNFGYVSDSNSNPTNNLNYANKFTCNPNSAYGGGYFNLYTRNNNSNYYIGIPGSNTKHYITIDSPYGIPRFLLDGTPIFQGLSQQDYTKKCVLAGQLLVNINNNLDYNGDGEKDFPVNTDGSASSIEQDVVTEVLEPAIPGNRIGTDQSVLVPIPSTFEDPSNPGIPLPQRTVKNRVKRGQDVALVPDLPSLQDKTPQDLGVLVVNNTDIQDTVISPTLSTTYIGENSTTFVIIPDNPGSTPIPEDNDSPLVSNPYPDVINPGNETISITANDDIFPTASEGSGENTTVRPSVSVSNPDEVASSAASEIVEGVSDIVKEGVSDLSTPLTPGEIEKGANRMRLAPQLLSKFPFCIPFDFYNSINQLAAPSEVPQFDLPFQIQSINFNHTFHIDLTNFETAAKISRWFFSVAWIVTLIFLTRKVIWK